MIRNYLYNYDIGVSFIILASPQQAYSGVGLINPLTYNLKVN